MITLYGWPGTVLKVLSQCFVIDMFLQAVVKEKMREVAVVEWEVLVLMEKTVVLASVGWVAGIIFQVRLSFCYFEYACVAFAGAFVMYAAGGGGGGFSYSFGNPPAGGGPGAGSGGTYFAGRCFKFYVSKYCIYLCVLNLLLMFLKLEQALSV
jgi:hypothetical protein